MEHERIIHILDFLTRCTDKQHGVTIQDIKRHLESQTNMQDVSPVTIRRDLERLERSGTQLETYTGAHNTRYYYMPQKGFTFNEIRFLTDSVSINKYLSPQQKHRLIKKFEVLCSQSEVRQLISRVSLDGRETPSYDLLENLEKVHAVISEKRKILFDYGKSDINGKLVYYHKQREMIPCRVTYFNDRFYLKCVDETTGNVRTYRIDRMKTIESGARVKRIPELPKPEGAVVDIFEPERFAVVRLRVKRFLLDEMLDQFGKFASAQDDETHADCVIIRANIGISKTFYQWLMQYGENAEILSPPDIRETMAQQLCAVLAQYQGDHTTGSAT
ncbi:MAG: WYL domain-containing protein [Ruminococcus sp.]|nr:WYL domain-containing protein [Ruminococcus sp.]